MNKKGFTLIELLAVIIILGILMIIAVPAVTKYINESRKDTYVNSAKNIAGGARILVNSGGLDLSDEDTTYYIDSECIKLDSGSDKSPYGEFTKAYVVVTANYDDHEYYWTSVDETGRGVKGLISVDKLDSDDIEENISSQDITTDRGLDNRNKIVLIDESCEKSAPVNRTGPKINSQTGESVYFCKKATTLHTETCQRGSGGCASIVGNGNEITYGTIVNGTPKAGDAYDCDVDNDGTWNSITERFYYLGSNGTNSILTYYRNVNNQTTYAYDTSGQNWHGPRSLYQYLPSTSEWDNPGIIAPGTRNIIAENGTGITTGGSIEPFIYDGRAARLLTTQELVNACSSISSIGNISVGELDSCSWLMEGLGQFEKSSGSYGYWLETPRSERTNYVWYLSGSDRDVNNDASGNSNRRGARPVITVLTSNIEK